MPARAQSNYPGQGSPGILFAVSDSPPVSQSSSYHQALHPAVLSQCFEETEISIVVFPSRKYEAGAKRAIPGSHQCHRRNEAV